jgi:hypothetical protein
MFTDPVTVNLVLSLKFIVVLDEATANVNDTQVSVVFIVMVWLDAIVTPSTETTPLEFQPALFIAEEALATSVRLVLLSMLATVPITALEVFRI